MKKAIFIVFTSFILAIVIIIFSQVVVNGSSGTGELQVTSQPAAKVYLDSQYLGQTPLCRCASVDQKSVLAAKDYTLKLIPNSGNKTPFYEQISIVKGVLTVVDRTFAGPAASEGSTLQLEALEDQSDSGMIVTSFPAKADILLDDNKIGQTPLDFANPTDSDHVLTIQKTGYKEKTLHIRTPKGYKLHVIVYLAIDPSMPLQPGGQTAQASESAALTPTQPQVVKVTILDTPTGFLRVRAQADQYSAEVEEVKPGDSLDYMSEQDGWFQVKLPDNKIGWVSNEYAKKD
ncbi:MAG TPA: PEGA domain-containing protein [Patescibacteria group bacterium]|nr:PEGA domain-containing protein [Patescibacteria group bacterium]